MNRHSHIPKPVMANSRKPLRLTEKPPTMSYSQLKVEVAGLQAENTELKQKLSKHQHSSITSKKAVKDLQKENNELKKKIKEEEKTHKETLSACQEDLLSKKTYLEEKLRNCEEALENSGINPVTLATLANDQAQKRSRQAAAVKSAEILREKLEDNMASYQTNIKSLEDISRQCQTMMKEMEEYSS